MLSSSAALTHRRRRVARTGLLAATAVAVSLAVSLPAEAATTYSVSPTGSDSASGTAAAPFRTLTRAFSALGPGDTLVVRGGTYRERVKATVAKGTASAPVRVVAAPGERPVVEGLLWLTSPDHWTLDGINVTWNTANAANEHMVKVTGGSGWRLTNAEIWGARSYAAVLVAGAPTSWSLDHLFVHDTAPSNQTNQDHLIYVNTSSGGGTIERSVLSGSRNGRGIKVGPPSGGTAPVGGVTIRYNTFFDNTGPSNIQLSYGASGNAIYRNIMQRSSTSNVTAFNLTGTGNVAYDNIGWESTKVLDTPAGLRDGGGNLRLDPRFDDTTRSFRPQAAAAQGYGAFAGTAAVAPAPAPAPVTSPSPSPSPSPSVTAPAVPATAVTTTLKAVADAQVKSSSPNANYGADTTLRTRTGSDVSYETLVRFTVAGLPTTPRSARLRLKVTDGTRDTLSVRTVASSGWTEPSVTWSTRPAATSAVLGQAVGARTGEFVDVALPVGAVPATGSVSFVVTSSAADSGIFTSREGGSAPELVISS